MVGTLDGNSASRLQAVDLSRPGSTSRAPSETSLRRLSPSMMFAKTSMPVGGASSSRDPAALGHAFLGRGQSGQPSTAQPIMTLHQLGSQDQFVVSPIVHSTAYMFQIDLWYTRVWRTYKNLPHNTAGNGGSVAPEINRMPLAQKRMLSLFRPHHSMHKLACSFTVRRDALTCSYSFQ